MRSPNLQEIYEVHLPFSLIIPVLLLLLNARTTLGVARVRIHLEKIIEFNRFVCVCWVDKYILPQLILLHVYNIHADIRE